MFTFRRTDAMEDKTFSNRPMMPKEKIKERLLEKSLSRYERFNTIQVNDPRDFPDSTTERVIYGTFSRTFPDTKRRYLWHGRCIMVSLDAPAFFETPAVLARDYLTLLYGSPKITHQQAEILKAVKTYMPLYAVPGLFGHGYYIDIKSAWWAIMCVLGWDVDYYPGRWMIAGRPPLDFPYSDNKISRSSLVTIARTTGITMFLPEKQKIVNVPIINQNLNWQIYGAISHVLGCIAAYGISVGAVYVNTDGLIAPTLEIAEKIIAEIEKWELNYTIKSQGPGYVLGPGGYRVGEMKSRRVMQPSKISNLPVGLDYKDFLFPIWEGIKKYRDKCHA